jgi:hypothetical protein
MVERQLSERRTRTLELIGVVTSQGLAQVRTSAPSLVRRPSGSAVSQSWQQDTRPLRNIVKRWFIRMVQILEESEPFALESSRRVSAEYRRMVAG